MEAELLMPDEWRLTDYVRAPAQPLDAMKADLLALAASIRDPDYRALLEAALSHPQTEALWTQPAAKQFHHAYFGGLLEHSLSVGRLAALTAAHYGSALRADLLTAGAVLHDLGKCWEFTSAKAPDYTFKGRLLGHVAMGAFFLEKLAVELPDFPPDKLLLLEHLLLSHHGDLDKGSPVTPKIVEGLALHYLDELDAKLNAAADHIAQELDGSEWTWTSHHRLMDTRFMATPKWPEASEPAAPSAAAPPDASEPALATKTTPSAAPAFFEVAAPSVAASERAFAEPLVAEPETNFAEPAPVSSSDNEPLVEFERSVDGVEDLLAALGPEPWPDAAPTIPSELEAAVSLAALEPEPWPAGGLTADQDGETTFEATSEATFEGAPELVQAAGPAEAPDGSSPDEAALDDESAAEEQPRRRARPKKTEPSPDAPPPPRLF
jgi:3'-5' exoribonuclease